VKKILTPPPSRLRPTVATLPNCSLLAIAYKGGEIRSIIRGSWILSKVDTEIETIN
jgi:hypothetical protein